MPTTTLVKDKKEYPDPIEMTMTEEKQEGVKEAVTTVAAPVTPLVPPKPKKNQQVVTDTVVFVCDRSKCQPIGLENSLIVAHGNKIIEIAHGLNYLTQADFDIALKVVPSLKQATTVIRPQTPELLFDTEGDLLSLDSFDGQGVKAIIRSITEYRAGWSNALAKFKTETTNRSYLKAIAKQEEALIRKSEIAKEEPTDLTRQLIDLYANQEYDALDEIFDEE